MACNKNSTDRPNGRRLTWLKSCWPDPLPETHMKFSHCRSENSQLSSLSSIPDDLLMEILARLPSSSLRSVSSVCRRFTDTLSSPLFFHLRHRLGRVSHRVVAFSPYCSGLLVSSLSDAGWNSGNPISFAGASLSHIVSAGRYAYLLCRIPLVTLRYDPWTGSVSYLSPMLCQRKRFAVGVIAGKIYVAGGAVRTDATGQRVPLLSLGEYNPATDTWKDVSVCPTCRYGCLGAVVGDFFFIIGGVRIVAGRRYVYESSMDVFDAGKMTWHRRRRPVPVGGCVVACCSVNRFVYILASHAVGVSFWKYDPGREEWKRLPEPVPVVEGTTTPPVRVDNAMRFTLVGAESAVVLVQTAGTIEDLWRRSGRVGRGSAEGLVLGFNCEKEEWCRRPDLPVWFAGGGGVVCGSICF